MPVEIRELIVRATVETQPPEERAPAPMAEEQRQRLIGECVEQVLEILRQQKER
jgi:hypothetical protein